MVANIGDAHQAAARIWQLDNVAGLDGKRTWRQRESGALACGPGFEQPGFSDGSTALGLQHNWHFGL